MNNRKLVIYLGAALIGLLLIFVVYLAFKKRATKPPEPATLPTGGLGIPAAGTGTNGQPIPWNPGPISDELHTVMDGIFTWSSTKNEAWKKYLDLPTDDMYVAVYNDFNTRHGQGLTLRAWMMDEAYTGTSDPRSAIYARMDRLGLR